ncbi:MAG TPA: hypothetical protein VJS64_15765 [Pyrinomonadaceae bacterium]|nr:hypothetical protein [Pyrinomonadaceae bacterium]
MKQCLVRELRYWIDRDLATTCETLTVPVRLVERDPLDAKRLKCPLRVPLWDRDRAKLGASRLTDDEPSRLVNERREGLSSLDSLFSTDS